MPGLTAAGLEIATISDVRATMNAAWRLAFGASMDVSDRSPDGQLIGIIAEPIAKLWEVLEAIVAARNPNAAVDAFLDAIAALTGTLRRAATFSTVTVTLTGVPTSSVPIDSLISAVSTGQQFKTAIAATIAAATAWAPSTAYVTGAELAGDRRHNAGNVYRCTTPGTSAGSGGPTSTDPEEDIVDGTAHWQFLGEGTGFVDVLARATVSGAIVAVALDLRNIDSPAGGWQGVINILDATLGAAKMTNAELRVQRSIDLAKPGTSPKNAIRSSLLEVGAGTSNPVTSVTVFSNRTDVTDVDGVPPHSIEALVRGGEDQAIWDALANNVADGIGTHGDVVGTSTDSAGNVETMRFSRTDELIVYVGVTLVKDPAVYPADGDDQVKAAIATGGNDRDDGVDVVSSKLIPLIDSVPGILEISLPLISVDPVTVPVSSAKIVVTSRQRALFDTSRITVASSDGTP